MPTGLDRIQVLCQPDTFAKVMTLVNVTGKTKSNLAHELIQHALKDEKYKGLLAEADEAQTVQPKEDPRTESRKGSFHRQPSAPKASVKEEESKLGVSVGQMHDLVMAKRQGRMSKEQEEVTQEALEMKKQEKKELLMSVLKELMDS